MKPSRLLTLPAILAMSLAVPVSAAAEPNVPAQQETRAEVPALDEFHNVIRQLWHEAWPNKDTAALRAMLPDIRKGADEVVKAELPGILREKQAAWADAVKELQGVVAEYAAAVEGADDQKLLDAGERLHSQFEKLARTIRPVLEELDAFHVVLYKLYHYELPAGDPAAIRTSAGNLKEAMATLKKARLPKRLEDRQKGFAAERRRLSAAVDRLSAVARSNAAERVRTAVEAVPDRYQALVGVFD